MPLFFPKKNFFFVFYFKGSKIELLAWAPQRNRLSTKIIKSSMSVKIFFCRKRIFGSATSDTGGRCCTVRPSTYAWKHIKRWMSAQVRVRKLWWWKLQKQKKKKKVARGRKIALGRHARFSRACDSSERAEADRRAVKRQRDLGAIVAVVGPLEFYGYGSWMKSLPPPILLRGLTDRWMARVNRRVQRTIFRCHRDSQKILALLQNFFSPHTDIFFPVFSPPRFFHKSSFSECATGLNKHEIRAWTNFFYFTFPS